MSILKKIGSVKGVDSNNIDFSPIGIGFEKLDRKLFEPEAAYDLLQKVGVKFIRLQSGWARTETEKGKYDFEWLDSVVDNLISRGLVPWMCFCYGNALYDEEAAQIFGAVGMPPIKNDIQRKAWCDYVENTVKHFAGRISMYEIWNEPDGKWCWKHGVNPTEYAELMTITSNAVKKADPNSKVIGGAMCGRKLYWLNEVMQNSKDAKIDFISYHGYDTDELNVSYEVKSLRALVAQYNPALELIQGETGTQSRCDGAGALRGAPWTPEKQAKFMARHMMTHLLDNVKFTSYFSALDMVEALNATTDNKESRLDYGYFGILEANFDSEGIAYGPYRPKPSYRTLQTIAAIFNGDFKVQDIPARFLRITTPFIRNRPEDDHSTIKYGSFTRDDGSAAFVYWKPSDILTTSYESNVSIAFVNMPEKATLVRLTTGDIYEIPPPSADESKSGARDLLHLPIYDEPMVILFGDFMLHQ